MKTSFIDRFLFRFSIVIKNDRLVFEKNDRFYKRPTRLKLLEKEWRSFLKTIVFIKTICDHFLYDYFFKKLSLLKKRSFLKKIVLTIILTTGNDVSQLTIVNEGLSLTIGNERTNFIKRIIFRKTIVFEEYKLHATLKLNSS